jgi:RNA polymerase sigma-70 factor (ECF subfamily)
MRSDKDLVDAVFNGDRTAFAALVERYERPVRSVAISILGRVDTVDDATQDAFTTSYEELATLNNRAAFGAWILKIAERAALRVARERSRNRPITADAIILDESNGKLDERSEKLLQALIRLPKHERLVVMLRYFDDESIESIATITGRPIGTVTKQLTRARNRLKELLGSQP